MLPASLPGIGAHSSCTLNNYDLEVVPGTWECGEPQRMADKISTGDLRYADFNPYESVSAQAVFSGGYGLQRYSDIVDPNVASTYIKECSDIDCRNIPVVLAPTRPVESTLGMDGPIVWFGEFTVAGTTHWVAVGGAQVWSRIPGGTWAPRLFLPAMAVQGAVGVFGGYLIIGFGAAATGVVTTDLATTQSVVLDTTGAAQFVFAVTADHAAAYIAGGTTTLQGNQVLGSPDGRTYQNVSATVCGSSSQPITALSPGGGLQTMYVGKTGEMGAIDPNGAYRTLVPFDSRLSTNCVGMRWFMGAGDNEQRGPQILIFPRDRALWTYLPDTQSGGTAHNASPWADPLLRPPTIRGIPTAFQGTARYLYWALQTSSGNTYIMTMDARSGVSLPWLNLGVTTVRAMGLTSLFGTNPLLFIGTNNQAVTVLLPLDGDVPLDDPNTRFIGTGTLDLPDVDLGLPDEDKIDYTVRVVADGLVPTAQYIKVAYRTDANVNLTQLGTANISPRTEMNFTPTPTLFRRLGLRLTFYTTQPQLTPRLWAVTLRASLNPKVYREWHFQAFVPAGEHQIGDALENPQQLIDDMWTARRAGIPVVFIDRWGTGQLVRIMELKEQETQPGNRDHVPESVLAVRLLEAPGSSVATIDTLYQLSVAGSPWFPFNPPWPTLALSDLNTSGTINNPGVGVVYPTLIITGPANYLAVTANGQSWVYPVPIGAGQTITANFTPGIQTVVAATGDDLSANVQPGSVYWGLNPGDNAITVQMSGATSSSSVTVRRSRY